VTFEEKVYRPLAAKTMDALDQAGLAINKRSVVVIRQDAGRVTAELTHWEMEKSDMPLKAVPGTLFTRP
jgi:hypothetical protein